MWNSIVTDTNLIFDCYVYHCGWAPLRSTDSKFCQNWKIEDWGDSPTLFEWSQGSFMCMNHRQSTHHLVFDKPVTLHWWTHVDINWSLTTGTQTQDWNECISHHCFMLGLKWRDVPCSESQTLKLLINQSISCYVYQYVIHSSPYTSHFKKMPELSFVRRIHRPIAADCDSVSYPNEWFL
jgi:hypothetical protein